MLHIEETNSLFCCGETKFSNYKEVAKKISKLKEQIKNKESELEWLSSARLKLEAEQKEHGAAIKLLENSDESETINHHHRNLKRIKESLNKNEITLKDKINSYRNLKVEEHDVTFNPFKNNNEYSFTE